MISRCTSRVPKEDVLFPRLLYCDSRCSQTCCRRSEACYQHTETGRQQSQTCRRSSQGLSRAPKVLSGTPRGSQTYHNHSHGTPVRVIRDRSYSKGRPEYPPRVWYSPEIDASMFTLHILSDTPGGFQRLKYILLMLEAFGGTPLFFYHSRRAWCNTVQVNMISGEGIWPSLSSMKELLNPSVYLPRLFAQW